MKTLTRIAVALERIAMALETNLLLLQNRPSEPLYPYYPYDPFYPTVTYCNKEADHETQP